MTKAFGNRTRCVGCGKLLWLGPHEKAEGKRCDDCAEIARADKVSGYQRAYRERNKDKVSGYQRAYYERNKDVLKVARELGVSVEEAREQLSI